MNHARSGADGVCKTLFGATAEWTAKPGMNLQNSTLKFNYQLGVDYNAHVIEAMLTHIAPVWR